jgi:hypothetical protein
MRALETLYACLIRVFGKLIVWCIIEDDMGVKNVSP